MGVRGDEPRAMPLVRRARDFARFELRRIERLAIDALGFCLQERTLRIHHQPVKILMNFPACLTERAPARNRER